jgi:predicted PurR-regulated permease PerM
MKKVKLAILVIYIIFFALISGATIFFIAKAVKEGTDLYFQQKQPTPYSLPLKESDVDKLIDTLRKLNLL